MSNTGDLYKYDNEPSEFFLRGLIKNLEHELELMEENDNLNEEGLREKIEKLNKIVKAYYSLSVVADVEDLEDIQANYKFHIQEIEEEIENRKKRYHESQDTSWGEFREEEKIKVQNEDEER